MDAPKFRDISAVAFELAVEAEVHFAVGSTTRKMALSFEDTLRNSRDVMPTSEHARIVAEKDARNAELSDVLNAIEMLTATGDGLSPEETIHIHILAAEGRFDDPHAWRADPAVIARLRAALKGDDNG